MNKVNWTGANYKDWVGVSAAPVFWVASLVCFVLGLSFKSGTGILIPGTNLDLIILFSIGLGFANTAIQIVGNDTDKDDLGMALWLMWGASYMLGIGSNVNFLYTVIGLNNLLLQFLVCWGLGIMIEVAPERLLVKFLRSVGILKTNKSLRREENQPSRSPSQSNSPRYEPQRQEQRGNPVYQEQAKSRFPEELKKQRPHLVPSKEPRGDYEPTYHPVSYIPGKEEN